MAGRGGTAIIGAPRATPAAVARVLAHVAYVTEEEPSPDPIGFVFDALSNPSTWIFLGGGALAIALAVAVWARVRLMEDAWRRFVERAESYREYVPWMLRLSVGLVIIGAGLSRVLFAPNVHLEGWPYAALTLIGFLLLIGFAVRPAALVGLAIYAVGLVVEPGLVEILDVAGGLAAVALV